MNRFVIAEPNHCIGCNTCMAACTAVHKAAGLQSYPRLTVTRTIDGTAPIMCRHCEDAPCARVCPVNAITHGADAIVLDEKSCVGCKMCALACPFGAITPSGTNTAGVAGVRANTPNHSAALSPLLVWEIGVRSVAVKCDLCASTADGPACVRVCPTKALFVVDQDRLGQANAAKRKFEFAWQGTGMPMTASQEQE
ncbi:4Fe-4S dicluster domain-containing protein [Telmatospirillum sp.]|uniref:4Fe-4S dicluster domain-containing protein n=1 Tax=Telmatospirillum sp. TaxID=2079197 RepID=UPI002847C2E7|nr:4Fe-4S dicluster domain-containing protein [Telmatospirillum sp.]MDR3438344.1 4Fe-4S dicluster domain-containing protein [Telmatospirillum sp.]